MKKNTVALAIFLGIIAAALGFMWLIREPDADFARKVFTGMVNGDVYVQKDIDWPVFQAVGADVGKEYSALPQPREKQLYVSAFIANLSVAFKEYGMKAGAFSNWRVIGREKLKTTVAANHPKGKVMVFTVTTQAGKKKLTSMFWKEDR